MPAELLTALDEDETLKQNLENLTPGRQREYADHLAEAKREVTKLKRLEKIKPMIRDGKGLYEKYKNW